MKKLHLLKRTLLLFALIVGCVSYGWAADPTITLTQSSLGVTGSSYGSGTKTIEGITFAYTDFLKSSDNIQAKASTGEIHNTTAFPTNIKSVAITHSGTARATTIHGSADGENWTQVATGSGSITGDFSNKGYKYFKITRGSNAAYWTQIVITYTEATPAGTTAIPTISGNTPFYGNTTVTITNDGSADGADIFYTLNGDDPSTTTSATCFAYSDPFQISATTTVKAIAKKSTDDNPSAVVSESFTKASPMTVTAALTAIDALADNGTIADQCVRGIVSTSGSLSSGAITYKVSVDGTTTNELQVYKGKGLYNADFENASDIAVGDEVVIYGTLKKYKSGATITPEFLDDNYLLSKVRKPAPTFSLDITEKTLEAYGNETVDVTLTTNTDGEIFCESDDADVATVALKSVNVYTITAQTEGTATITIRSALSANYAPASATVAITVQDSRADAGISFEDDADETTWGESYTTQTLTNTNSVAVTWSSTDETVATVNSSTGAITILKAGETDIKATFAGNATYKAAVASYTLTVNRAEAGLSYTTTSFDIMLNDASFEAPTLNNPNSLTVTYASNNTEVAVVDENTGELVYDETAEGTAKITATFEGNDWFKAGSANYTINIIDYSKKGSKYNPYTVAEVIEMAPSSTTTPDAGESDIYVIGYIVGEYRTPSAKTTTVLQSDFTTDANIAIADDPTTTALASSIPVNLTKVADKTAFGNLTNHGKTIGYKVLVKGDALKYFGVPGFKNIDEISAVSVPATVTTAKYATFASPYATDFSETGITVYTAKDNATSVTLNEVTSGQVPANTPVVLYKEGADGSAINVPVIASADPVGDNDLEVSDGESATGEGIYVLANKSKGVGFYPWTSGSSLSAGKVFLRIAGGSAREFIGFEEGETTAINAALMNNERMSNEVYNLNGQRVAQPSKGLYIVNGKKVIIK